MLPLDHENLAKTRRSILIVCTTIIATENYLSPELASINFGGVVIMITKWNIVNGLCVGLLYLWFIAISHVGTGPLTGYLKLSFDNQREGVSIAFGPDPNERPNDSFVGDIDDDTEFKLLRAIDAKALRSKTIIEIYSNGVVLIPPILLTLFVWVKYNGLFRVVYMIKNLVIN